MPISRTDVSTGGGGGGVAMWCKRGGAEGKGSHLSLLIRVALVLNNIDRL